MRLIKVGAAVLNQVPLDWDGNLARIRAAIDEARAADIQVLCLPEMCLPGYGCEDAFDSGYVAETSMKLLGTIASQSSQMIVSVGMPLRHDGTLYNSACLVADGKVAGFACKKNLAGTGVYYEPRWFRAWPQGARDTLATPYGEVPIGDLVFESADVRIAFEICEDAWVAHRGESNFIEAGVDLVLNPSASHFAFDKFSVRKRICAEGSRMFGVAYVYANLLGNESGRLIFDGGAIIASQGKVVAEGPRLTYDDVLVTACQVDIDENRRVRSRSKATRIQKEVSLDFELQGQQQDQSGEIEPAAWELAPHQKYEEFTRAVSLGLFDYMRKSFSKGFVVSLSGGADSAAVATLVSLALREAARQLAPEELQRKLHFLPSEALSDADTLVSSLLLCVYQATKNSSEQTQESARAVAGALGGEFLSFDVDEIVQSYTERVSAALMRPLTWTEDDLALQNIQARVRGPLVWMFANIRGALLLATSNRSEAAVGYATMDGDTCGGLSPIAGIDKEFLLNWLVWMEKTGPHAMGPIPALGVVNRMKPTAELRPPAAVQTDEDDLMPYDILEAIEEEAIRDRNAPVDVWRKVSARFGQHESAHVGQWVVRFFTLFARNQWKRERYAPSFHLDDENLDPKTWFRFPILSGGFKRELRELQNALDDYPTKK